MKNIAIPDKLHRKLKREAFDKDIFLKDYVVEKLS